LIDHVPQMQIALGLKKQFASLAIVKLGNGVSNQGLKWAFLT